MICLLSDLFNLASVCSSRCLVVVVLECSSIVTRTSRVQSSDSWSVQRSTSASGLQSCPRRHKSQDCKTTLKASRLLRLRILRSQRLPRRTRLLGQRPLNLPSYLRGIRQRLPTPPLPDLFNNLIYHLIKLNARIQRNSQCSTCHVFQTFLAMHGRALPACLEFVLDPSLAGRQSESAADRDADDGIEPDGGPCTDTVR
jgi:hypothetical protein